jgi:serine/threonine protein kinase
MSERPAAAQDGAAALAARLAEDMARRWRQGERPLAEEYLAHYPEVRGDPEAAIDLIHEEICLREEHGVPAATPEILSRFPQWRAELEVLLGCHRLLEPLPPTPRFPLAGETLGDFRLLAELGRGARGRVFLATQPALADRPVVLKITPRGGGEHLALARLQHTHIVPLYAVYDDPARDLRLLCMPYFGGTTLTRLLDALRDRSPSQRSGRDLLAALDRAQAEQPMALPAQGWARQFLARASYVQSVCWIGACLAEALHYAHARGLVHLDLKPSNVLLAADGQPMLLDFHLAQEPLHPDRPLPERLGGSPPYMAPEQRAALDALREGRPIPTGVDGRSDLYALGVLLYEALSGTRPARPAAALHRRSPGVSVGLSDVVHKCLAPDPDGRYADAAALAGDLHCHLADLPLRGVANRSLRERWRKWRRRRPYAHTLTVMLLAVLSAALAVGAVTWFYFQREFEDARTALAEGQTLMEERHYAEALRSFRRGLDRTEGLWANEVLAQKLRQQLRAAERAQLAQELHAVAERVRDQHDADTLPAATQQDLEAVCWALWAKRDEIVSRLHEGLGPEQLRQVHDDLLDLALLGTDRRVRRAPPQGVARALREALQVLAEAEALHGPSPVLDHERQRYALALGDGEAAQEAGRRAAARAPRTAWEHYALGRALLRRATEQGSAPDLGQFVVRHGGLALAARELERAVEMQPQALWPHFYRGKCAFLLGRHADAESAFTACVVLVPEFASAFYHRALARTALGQRDRALRDCRRALELDPGLADAAQALGRRLQANP